MELQRACRSRSDERSTSISRLVQATASQMREAIEKELRELDARDDHYLDLYGEGRMPKAKSTNGSRPSTTSGHD